MDKGLMYFYFAPRIMLSKENYLYSFLTLAAEIGGYVGVLLGISFLHLSKVVMRVIDRRWRQRKSTPQPPWLRQVNSTSSSTFDDDDYMPTPLDSESKKPWSP